MWSAILQLIVAVSIASGAPAQRKPRRPKPPAPAATLPCGAVLSFQILLDRQGFSPGQIDGKIGANLSHAVSALQAARKLPVTGELDCATWHALGGDAAGDVLAPYTLSDADVSGPYEKNIPSDLNEQATLPALGYGSLLERIGERFHAAPALLLELNRGVPLKAGATIKVPAVTPFDAAAKPAADPAVSGDVTIVVSKDDSSLRALRSDGTLLFFAPVTTGSEHDPLPLGDWKVTGVQWNPPFHYNPDLFWDAKADASKATIKPGPNNPVGVAWIDLDLEHYGLHGTPEPANVGHTASHGCVRLTNWDVVRVASLVKPGTPVQFR
jgi:lipoprotein-anchoring transpeptidase ErfK/SrfK